MSLQIQKTFARAVHRHLLRHTPLPGAAAMFSSTTAVAAASGFEKVGVIGLGLMGHGICQVAAASGIHSKGIVAYEPEQKFLDSGKSRIEGSLSKLVSKGKMTQEAADKTLSTILFTTDMGELKDADMIVEAVIEKMDLKQELYTSLGSLCDEKTIFASNTSGLSITEMAQFSGRTDRFVGVHFFNPVQLMKLVEVIHTKESNPEVFDKCYAWVEEIGKRPPPLSKRLSTHVKLTTFSSSCIFIWVDDELQERFLYHAEIHQASSLTDFWYRVLFSPCSW